MHVLRHMSPLVKRLSITQPHPQKMTGLRTKAQTSIHSLLSIGIAFQCERVCVCVVVYLVSCIHYSPLFTDNSRKHNRSDQQKVTGIAMATIALRNCPRFFALLDPTPTFPRSVRINPKAYELKRRPDLRLIKLMNGGKLACIHYHTTEVSHIP